MHRIHFGGVPEFLEEGTKIVGGPDYVGARDDMMGLQTYFGKRTFKLWGSTLKRDTPPKPIPHITPDIFEGRVMGQPEAVATVLDLVALVKAGLTDPGKPYGVSPAQ